MPKAVKQQKQKDEPDFRITVECRKSSLNEDILVRHITQFGKLAATEETRYPASEGEALTREFLKGIGKLQDLIELEAKNNPLIKT